MALTKVSGDQLDAGVSIAGVVTATGFDGPFSGIVTASSFKGDGSGLTGVSTNFVSAVGIQSGGDAIGVGITQLNFVGVGNTFAVDGTTVDVSIAGGGGAAPGTRLNYPGGSQSPFYHSFARITEDISLDATYIGETVESNVVAAEETITVNTGVALTIGEGKTVIPDLYKIFA